MAGAASGHFPIPNTWAAERSTRTMKLEGHPLFVHSGMPLQLYSPSQASAAHAGLTKHPGAAPGLIYMMLRAISPPKCKKRALVNQNRAPENCHRLQCKSLFNVADLESVGCGK